MEKISPNKLWSKDQELFDKMSNDFITENEKNFFVNLKFKQEYEYTCAGDLLLHESTNTLNLFLVRIDYDEFLLGKRNDDGSCDEYHFQSLFDVLQANLKDLNLSNEEITLFDWLRGRDYEGLEYQHNYDDL